MTLWEQHLEGWGTRGLLEGRGELNEAEAPRRMLPPPPSANCQQPPEGLPCPLVRKRLPFHKPDWQQPHLPCQAGLRAKPRLGGLPLGAPGGCASIFAGAGHLRQVKSPKPVAAFDISDPYDVPGSTLAAEATFCQEVCGCVGRGQGLLKDQPPQSSLSSLRRGVASSTQLGVRFRQTWPGIQFSGFRLAAQPSLSLHFLTCEVKVPRPQSGPLISPLPLAALTKDFSEKSWHQMGRKRQATRGTE